MLSMNDWIQCFKVFYYSDTKKLPEKNYTSPDLTQIHTVTKRGEVSFSQESFAPGDFTFNASSFVFQPLSPRSAAGFLCPSQESASSMSFMETVPKR